MKIVKTVSCLLISGLMAIAVAGCASGQEGGAADVFDKIALWGASNTESIMMDEPVRDVSPDLELYAIKGETESGQFIMTSLHDDLVAGYKVEAGDLKQTNGSGVISSSNVELFNQKYIKVERNSWVKNDNRTALMLTGYYPDALIPMESAVARRENRLEPEFNQGVWVNVNVPKDAPAGEYTGKITVKIGTAQKDVSVKLTVFDLAMPQTVHARSMYAIWYQLIERGEEVESSLALEEAYYNFLSEKRINPTEVPTSAYSSPEEFADYIVAYAKNEKVTDYRLPLTLNSVNGSYTVNKDSGKSYLIAMAEKQRELRAAGDETDLFKKAFWYTIDEPDYTGHMDDVAPAERALVEIKDEVAAAYPEFADSIKKVAHIMVTQWLHPENAGSDAEGGIQTWCSQLNYFDSDKTYELDGDTLTAREFIQNRKSNSEEKAAGQDVWWYHCNMPENPYPTCMVDDNLIGMRLLTWAQYNLDISGTLYWCVNYYQKLDNSGAIVNRDLWNDPNTMGRSNQDGCLLYPGNAYGITGPIGTLRLESIRESKEDYEYFWMLEQRLAQLNTKYEKNYDAFAVQAKYLNGLLSKDVIPVIDGGKENALFASRRKALLQLLETVCGSDEAAALRALDALN